MELLKNFFAPIVRTRDALSKTGSRSVATLLIFLGLYSSTALAVGPELIKGAIPVPGKDYTDEVLFNYDDGVIMENDLFTLKWETSGSLAIYHYGGSEKLWTSGTEYQGKSLQFRASDGKFVIRNEDGTVIWPDNPVSCQKVALLENLNLVMYDGSGQVVWETDTSLPEISSDELQTLTGDIEEARDYLIPRYSSIKTLLLRAEGADGGMRHIKDFGNTRFKVKGGEGATIQAMFQIGTGDRMIPPGSILRFIVGRRSATLFRQTTTGCGGGGGTAVLLKKPRSVNWYLLIAAGGGGGAYSDCCTVKSEGKPGAITENGSDGKGSGGAKGGYYGEAGKNLFSGTTGTGGGGAFKGPTSNAAWPDGSVDGSISLPKGIDGRNARWQGTGTGGWGFGGGGGAGNSGGGGGGFSGGGAGQTFHGGGGGSSYLLDALVIPGTTLKIQNGTTDDPGDGFVNYQLNVEDQVVLTRGRTFNLDTELLSVGRYNKYHLTLQKDGNLVLYKDAPLEADVLWASGTNEKGATLAFQNDGNLVIQDAGGKAIWAAGTADAQQGGKGGQYLTLLPDGNLIIADTDGKRLWQSNTSKF